MGLGMPADIINLFKEWKLHGHDISRNFQTQILTWLCYWSKKNDINF